MSRKKDHMNWNTAPNTFQPDPKAWCKIVVKTGGCTLEFGSLPRPAFDHCVATLLQAVPKENRRLVGERRVWWIESPAFRALDAWRRQHFLRHRVTFEDLRKARPTGAVAV
jgi:hypothetical protein